MGTLDWEYLSKLSMFKCQVCLYRLQSPIMQVELFGNICGSCYGRSVFTNVTGNIDVEAIMLKLCVPCRYVEKGCDYEDAFASTCDHEKECDFRDKICPFYYLEKCDSVDINNIIQHFELYHGNNILIAENNVIELQNPSEFKCENFYMVKINDKYFLMRTKFEKDKCYYILYYFQNNDDSFDNVSFFLSTTYEDFDVKGKQISGVSDIISSYTFDATEALIISSKTLTNLNCLESVRISFMIGDSDIVCNDEILKVYKCSVCKKYRINGGYYCYSCIDEIYNNGGYSYHTNNVFGSSELSAVCEYPCLNTGCNMLIKGDQYEMHSMNCLFKKYICPFKSIDSCKWEDICTKLVLHVKQTHASFFGRKTDTIKENNLYTWCIIKNSNVIMCKYSLINIYDLRLEISLIGSTTLDNQYLWEIQIKKKDSLCKMILSDYCKNISNAHAKTINVMEYVVNGTLTFDIFIHHKNTQE